MSHVFISYSKKNRDYARKLADDLLVHGFNVWIDDRIDYGESWERVIFKAIDDCSAFVVIMTPESYESDWVLRECQYAERRKKPQYPILLSGEVFPRYGPTQYVDASNGDLPPNEFYDEIDDDAPRLTEQSGQEISASSQSTLIADKPQPPADPETLMPLGIDQRAAYPMQEPMPRSAPPKSGLSRGTWFKIGIFALAVLALAFMLINAPDGQTPTPTPTEPRIPTATMGADAAGPTEAATEAATSAVSDLQLPEAQLSFVSDRNGNYDIFMMNADGDVQPLVTNDDFDGDPAWASDGSHLAFASYRDQNWEIYTMDADAEGEEPLRLTNDAALDEYPSWSPNWLQLVFISERDGNPDIFKIDANGDGIQNLTQDDSSDTQPVWSPDGESIAFMSERDGNQEIYLMGDDGSSPRNLTQNDANDEFPRWSPDGSQIAFTSFRDGNGEIYVMYADGENPHNLTQNEADDTIAAWSPDGEWIAFVSDRDGNLEIYIMDTAGENVQRLTDNPAEDNYPAWRPSPS